MSVRRRAKKKKKKKKKKSAATETVKVIFKIHLSSSRGKQKAVTINPGLQAAIDLFSRADAAYISIFL